MTRKNKPKTFNKVEGPKWSFLKLRDHNEPRPKDTGQKKAIYQLFLLDTLRLSF